MTEPLIGIDLIDPDLIKTEFATDDDEEEENDAISDDVWTDDALIMMPELILTEDDAEATDESVCDRDPKVKRSDFK